MSFDRAEIAFVLSLFVGSNHDLMKEDRKFECLEKTSDKLQTPCQGLTCSVLLSLASLGK